MDSKYKWLNKASRLFLERGYLQEGVTPEARVRQVMEAAERYCGIEGFADETEEFMAMGDYTFSTPMWNNFGNERGLPVSCFGSYIPDDTIQIFEKLGEVALMSKHGGGTSGYFGDVRPRGAPIKTSGGHTDGPVRFMELFDKTADVISQGSSRRGSFAAYLPVEHPDVEEFLRIRSEGNAIQNMSIGITITDKWMEEMVAGDKAKRKTWGLIIKKRFETGYPYIVFIDTVNRNAPDVYKNKGMPILASNLCVAGNQRVVSRLGLLTAKELYDLQEPLTLFNNKHTVESTPMRLVEKNADTYKITLENGLSHTITSYHKVLTRITDPYTKPLYQDKECKDLKIGDYVGFQTKKGIFGSTSLKDEAFLLGLYQADGTQNKDTIHLCLWENDFDLLEEVQEKFDNIYNKYNCDDLIDFSRNLNKNPHKPKFRDSDTGHSMVKKKTLASPALKRALNFEKGYIPQWIWSGDEQTQWQYVRGLFYADGTVNVTSSKGNPFYLSITNINKEFLEELQILLLNLGIITALSISAESGERLLPDGKGGQKEYITQTSYRLVCGSKNAGIIFEQNTGFLSRKGVILDKINYRDNTKKYSKIKSIEFIGKQDVFCISITGPDKHWICNGIVSHNCSEISLASDAWNSFVCVLMSLNVANWRRIKANPRIVRNAIILLDCVCEEFIRKTENMPFMKAAHDFAKKQRALGLGILGWHSLLQSEMIPFESMEAKVLNNEIWKFIREHADKATQELAVLLGEPELMEGTGRRNVTTLAVAPTTSSSFILGQISPSIEPENSCYYVKKLAKGNFTYRNPYLEKLLKEKEQNDDETWKSILVHGGSVQHLKFLTQHEKDVFKTFGEISQKEIVIQAAQRQKYIDQSQSLNLMIPSTTKAKDVSDLMIEAWKLGVKSLYYQRSSNPAQQLARNILTCTSCEA